MSCAIVAAHQDSFAVGGIFDRRRVALEGGRVNLGTGGGVPDGGIVGGELARKGLAVGGKG